MKWRFRKKTEHDEAAFSASPFSASPPASSSDIAGEPPDAELVVAVFRTVVLVAALSVPRLVNGVVPIAQPLIWLAAVAGAYNLLVVGAYFWKGRNSLRRPFIIGMDLMLIMLWIHLTSGWSLFPLFYVVVVIAAMWYRIWGGIVTALCCNSLYLLILVRGFAASADAAPPSIIETFRVVLQLPFLGTSLALNIAMLFLVGSLVGSLALAQERERMRRMEEQLLLANYQREIDLSTQLQPLLVSREWFDAVAPINTNGVAFSDVIFSEAARNTSQSSTRSSPELLPLSRTTMAHKAHIRLGATMQTAREFGGGDYFDFIPLENGRSALCIADVSGKSVRAQARLPLLKYALRALAPLYSEPDALMKRLNQTLAPDLQEDLFIGLCYVVLDPRANKLQWCNAGHIAPLVLPLREIDDKGRAIPQIIALETLGPALGLFPDATYETKTSGWRAGDRLLMFTDGLTDALSYRGREDGEEQVRHIALETEASFWLEPQSVAQTLLAMAQDALDDHEPFLSRLSPLRRHDETTVGRASERRDDITIVVARRTLPEED